MYPKKIYKGMQDEIKKFCKVTKSALIEKFFKFTRHYKANSTKLRSLTTSVLYLVVFCIQTTFVNKWL